MGDRVFYVAARTFPAHAGMGLFSADSGDQALAGFVGQGDRVYSHGPVTDRKILAALELEAEAPAPAGGKKSKKAAAAPAETPAAEIEQAAPETETPAAE